MEFYFFVNELELEYPVLGFSSYHSSVAIEFIKKTFFLIILNKKLTATDSATNESKAFINSASSSLTTFVRSVESVFASLFSSSQLGVSLSSVSRHSSSAPLPPLVRSALPPLGRERRILTFPGRSSS